MDEETAAYSEMYGTIESEGQNGYTEERSSGGNPHK